MSNLPIPHVGEIPVHAKHLHLLSLSELPLPDQRKIANLTSAYNIFKSENNEKVKETIKKKGLKVTGPEMSKLLSAQWKAMGTSEKKKYEDKANANRVKVHALIKAWRSEQPRKRRSPSDAPLPEGWEAVPETEKKRKYYQNEDLDVVVFSRPYEMAEGLKHTAKKEMSEKTKAKKSAGEPAKKKAKISA